MNADPKSWKAGDGYAIGLMLADELSQLVLRFINTRVTHAVDHTARHGGDPLDVLSSVAQGLRLAADTLEASVDTRRGVGAERISNGGGRRATPHSPRPSPMRTTGFSKGGEVP